MSFAKKTNFAAKSYFRSLLCSPFLSCERSVTVLRNGTRVPKSISQLRNTLRNGTLDAKSGIFTLYSFAAVSQLRIGGSCAAKWHSCAKIGFAAAKIFAEESNELRNAFAKDGRFRRDMLISQQLRLSCEMVSQRSANFAEDFLRLRSLAEPCFCFVHTLFLLCCWSDFALISSF